MPVQFVGFVLGKIRKAEYRIREVVTQRVKLQVYEKCPPLDGVQFNFIRHFLFNGFYPFLKTGGLLHTRNICH